jgi:hypothetical protein
MVVLGGSAATLSVLARTRIELIDAKDREAKQPYHAVEFLCAEEAAGRLRGYLETATAMAGSAIGAQCAILEEHGYRVRSIGILDSAARNASSLSAILASHALIHAADGNHFRNALSAAAELHGLSVHRMPARHLEDHAVDQLHLPLKRLLGTVNDLGRQVGPPWGADQKKAALLAWTLLTTPPRV